MITFSLSGYLCENGFSGGWPSIFYVFGTFGLVWSLIWFIFSSNDPVSNSFISKHEKQYIISKTVNLQDDEKVNLF